ncbi:hypothetical protein, partial [Bradyrhizobium oligotrophicum]|uniref:hypothetical protein n=1 Tax=Bradyrhizobium oligotrophicum TaxID=44255 RepID=UPI003EBA2C24
QLIVDGIQALAGLRQELTQQIVHETGLPRIGAAVTGRPLILSERRPVPAFTSSADRYPALADSAEQTFVHAIVRWGFYPSR